MRKQRVFAVILALSMILPTVQVFADNEDETASEQTLITGEYEAGNDIIEVPEEKEESEPVNTVKIPEQAKTLLPSLGILTQIEMGLKGLVTRNFAAEVVMRMAGFDTTQPATGTVYDDVDADSLYAYSIEQASKLGYFSGTGYGCFSPDLTITDKQMATVLLRFAGYEAKIPFESVYGKVLKSVNSGDDLTYGDLSIMIYNVLNLGTVNLKSMSKTGSNSYTIDDNKTVLNDWFSVYLTEGIIKKTGKTALFSSTDIASDEISIDIGSGLFTLKIGNSGIEKELGKYAKIYYKADDKSGTRTCISYTIPEGRNTIVEFSLNDLNVSDSNATQLIYYDETGKRNKIHYSASTAIIYNECYYAYGFSPSALADKEGTLCAVDNNGDNTFDVFYIVAYVPHRVKSVVLSSNTINFKDGGSVTLTKDKYDEFKLIYANGVNANLEDFTEDFIVSVAESTSSYRSIKVIVSEKIEEGVISAINDNDAGNRVLTIDDSNTYRMVNLTYTGSAGKGVRLFVTFLGNVVDVEMSGNVGFQFGILAKYKYNKKDENLYIKIINTDNQYEEYTVSEKLRVDGKVYRYIVDMIAALEAPDDGDVGHYRMSLMHRYPIRYRCNKDGVLLAIDTPKIDGNETTKDSLHLMGDYWSSTDKEYVSKKGYMNNYVLGFETPISPSTLIFSVTAAERYNTGGADYDTWSSLWTQEIFDNPIYTSVDTAKDLASTYAKKNMAYFAYTCNDDNNLAEIVLLPGGPGSSTNSSSLFMYDRRRDFYDEENDEVLTKLIGYLGGVQTEIVVSPEYLSEPKVSGLSRGDVITYGKNELGRLSNVWEVAKHTTVTDASGTYPAFTLRTVRDSDGKSFETKVGKDSTDRKLTAAIGFGYVLQRKGDLICMQSIDIGNMHNGTATSAPTIKYSDIKNPPSSVKGTKVWIRIPASTPVMVYNEADDEVYVGTYDEILDNPKHSFIGIRYTSDTTIAEIIVFNENF